MTGLSVASRAVVADHHKFMGHAPEYSDGQTTEVGVRDSCMGPLALRRGINHINSRSERQLTGVTNCVAALVRATHTGTPY